MDKNLLPYYNGCYVCSQTSQCGLHQRFYVKNDKIYSHFKPSSSFQGYEGFVHGGVFSAILDESMGWAASVKVKGFCKTVKLEIRFSKETPSDKLYTIESEYMRTVRGFLEAKGKVYDEQGSVYVRGEGIYYPMPSEFTNWAKDLVIYDENTLKVFDKEQT